MQKLTKQQFKALKELDDKAHQLNCLSTGTAYDEERAKLAARVGELKAALGLK